MRIPVLIDFGDIAASFKDVQLKPVAAYHTDRLFETGFSLDDFTIDLDLTGIMDILLPPPGAVDDVDDRLLVCRNETCAEQIGVENSYIAYGC